MERPDRLLQWLRRITLVVGVLSGSVVPAAAQGDSAAAQLRTVLRAFYFNLARHDWQAIAADVLSAKVLASRAFPPGVKAPLEPPQPGGCSPLSSPADHALIRIQGDWAAVSVSRCAGADEFRLIRLENRWRFISIALFQEPTVVSLTSFERGLFLRRCPSDAPAHSRRAACLAGRAARFVGYLE